MHYTSVLFDLDGTLLDTLGDLTAAMNRTLTRHGLPERTRQQMRAALGNGARRLMELSVPAGTDGALFETLLAEYNADYAAHCRIETAPYPGVAALLLKLHAQGRKLAIVSNKPDEAVRALRAAAAAANVLLLAVSALVTRGRPGPVRALYLLNAPSYNIGTFVLPFVQSFLPPDMLLAAMVQLGAERTSTVYVGDSEVDIATARAAGLPCISVLWGFRDRDVLERAGAQQFAADIAQLQALLG